MERKADICIADGCGTDLLGHLSPEKKLILDLSGNSQKPDLFAADQTPTPTSFIKNCEEVGLFDDLQHVNPFEETFRRAVEQNVGQSSVRQEQPDHSEDTLHTPQVYPLLESTTDSDYRNGCDILQETSVAATPVTLNVPVVDNLLAENDAFHLSTSHQRSLSTTQLDYHKPQDANNNEDIPFLQVPTVTHFVQPQVFTLNLTTNGLPTVVHKENSINATSPIIPVQTVKPFILPKVSITSTLPTDDISALKPYSCHEPSSASLTPPSQLPIKERLKAILSNNSIRVNEVEVVRKLPKKLAGRGDLNPYSKDNELNERKKAAATRYRDKLRCKQNELQRRNTELLAENTKLRERVRMLEQQLAKQVPVGSGNGAVFTVPAQIQIPSSTIHLVMNVPKMTVPLCGQTRLESFIP